ncbi:MAG: aldehyde dehydrogenase family protein [Pseudomonadota bacterium]
MDLSTLTLNDWKEIANAVIPVTPTQLFIGGELVDAASGERFETVNPANGEVLAAVSAGSAGDVDRAVASARASFRGGSWSQMAPRDRMAVMYRWADLVRDAFRELAVLEVSDMGKNVSDVISVDLPMVADFIQFCGECIDKIEGRVTNTQHDVLHFVQREPLGVVAAVSPWNYPLLMATWKVAPALAAGNSVVLKPAELSPLSCIRLAQLFIEAGGPAGVFNVVNGMGDVAGKALALHDDVAKISFTGSTRVGKLMLQYAGQSNMKRVSLETGGKSPQIFLNDLPDMDAAVEAAIYGIYYNQGEVCSAGSRLLVERGIYEDFVSAFRQRGSTEFKVGDPLDPDTMMGPLVSFAAQQRVLSYIETGSEEGACLEFGGRVPEGLEAGAYVAPTLFTDVNNEMTIAREEIFGPVASILPVNDVEQAVAIANDTPYGLAASVWTADLAKAHRCIKSLEAGMVWVNSYDDMDMTMPFGGYKQSGNAKDNCMESVLSYTQQKAAWISLAE